jgi:hypothetical protein
MDKGTTPITISSPNDHLGILDSRFGTNYLLDPRVQTDDTDTTGIKTLLTLPTKNPESFNFTGDSYGSVDHRKYHNIQLSVDQNPDYLVMDSHFRVSGLNTPRGWYSTSQKRAGTRTQSVIPIRPKDHDYRLEWDLTITGNFELGLSQRSILTNYNVMYINQKKSIDFKFPLNIYVWFDSDPVIESIDFLDFNVGTAINKTAWVITSESHLVEYFEKEFWRYIKPFFTTAFDGAYSILHYALAGQGLLLYSRNSNNRYLENLVLNSKLLKANWLMDVLMFQSNALKSSYNENLNNLWLRFDVFMKEYFLDFLNQYDPDYDLFSILDRPQFPHPAFQPWISALGYDITLSFNQFTNIVNITLHHSTGYFSLIFHGFNQSRSELQLDLISVYDIPGMLQLTTFITTVEHIGKSIRPNLDASGILYDKYSMDTNIFSKPSFLISDSNNVITKTSNDNILFTRSKFGDHVRVGSFLIDDILIQLDNSNENNDYGSTDASEVSMEITLLLQAGRQELSSELELIIDTVSDDIETERPEEIDIDIVLHHRLYASRWFEVISKEMLKWLSNFEEYPKIGLDIRLMSSSTTDFNNVTIFLTEASSMQNFFTWLGKYGYELLVSLHNQENTIFSFIRTLNNDPDLLSIKDLERMDFEFYNLRLESFIQENIGIESEILKTYQLIGSERYNLLLLMAIPGTSLVSLYNGLSVGEIDLTDKISGRPKQSLMRNTFIQVYYCHRLKEDNREIINLLTGIDIVV